MDTLYVDFIGGCFSMWIETEGQRHNMGSRSTYAQVLRFKVNRKFQRLVATEEAKYFTVLGG